MLIGETEFAGQENAGLENDGQKLQGGVENDGQTIKVSYVELHNLTLLSRKYWTQVVMCVNMTRTFWNRLIRSVCSGRT